MRLLKTTIAMLCLVFLAGCSFQSSAILPDTSAAGDPIAGLPTDAPFRLESFDRQKNVFHYIGTMTPETTEGGLVRYTLAFEGDSKKLLIQAKNLSGDSYVLRYTGLRDGAEPDVNDSALVFVTVESGTYHVLSSLADRKLFEKVYEGAPRPAVVGDAITFDTDAQAVRLSAYFAGHRREFLTDQDYVRIRLMK